MIKPQDLCIGNWVKSNDLWLTVSGISSNSFTATHRGLIYFNQEDVQPIPLTQEAIIKFGFNARTGIPFPGWYSPTVQGRGMRLTYSMNKFYFHLSDIDNIEIPWVHSLQNLFLNLYFKNLSIVDS